MPVGTVLPGGLKGRKALALLVVLWAAMPLGSAAAGPKYTGMAVAHYPGGVAAGNIVAPDEETFATGFTGAGEPDIAVAKDGTLYADVTSKVITSNDGGRSWRDVSPTHPTSLDPYLYLDPKTQRLFKSDLLATCQDFSWSDDKGATWSDSLAGCNLSDHQTIVAAPPVSSPTVGYPNVLYNCSQTVGYNGYSLASGCDKSLDGGRTWVFTGSFAFADPSPYGTGPGSGDSGIPGECIGDIGPIFGGSDGALYVPRGWCGQPWLAVSKDEGLTWQRTEASHNGMNTTLSGGFGVVAPGSGQSDHEAAVVADKSGNVFFMWMALDRLPYMAVSKNHGASFGPPMMMGPPGLKEAWGPSLAIDDNGRVSLAYMGTTNSPGAPWTGDYTHTTWTGYLALVPAPTDARPLIYSAPASPASHPLAVGACGPDRCNSVILDFIDNEIAPDGSAWAAFVDSSATGRGQLLAAHLLAPAAAVATASPSPAPRVLPNTGPLKVPLPAAPVALAGLALAGLVLIRLVLIKRARRPS